MRDAGKRSLPARWGVFIGERFPPAAHCTMAALFAAGNMAVAARLAQVDIRLSDALRAVLLCMLFFFRLRCFDEIKDLDVDRAQNPTRPLARGLLGVGEVLRMIGLLVVLEFLLVLPGGGPAVWTYLLALTYSLLMFREFFVGPWLRPHLTSYAVAHTFVSILLGWTVAAMVSGRAFFAFPVPLLAFGLVNWMVFNVFEFARKTFCADEEKPGADSYSRRFGPMGAVLLCASQMMVAFAAAGALVLWRQEYRWAWLGLHAALVVIPLVAGLRYARRPGVQSARRYRGIVSLYLVLFFLSLAGLLLAPPERIPCRHLEQSARWLFMAAS